MAAADRRARRRAREPGTRAASCARASSRAASAAFRATDTIRSKPAFNAEMHPVVTPSRARRAGVERAVHLRGRRARAGVLPGGHAPAGRAPLRAARGCSRRSRRAATTASAARSTPSPTRPAWSRSRGAARAGVRASRGGGAGADALGPRRRPPCSPTSPAGPGGRLVAVWDGGVDDQASVVRAAVADGRRRAVRAARGRLGGRARLALRPRGLRRRAARSWCSPAARPPRGELGGAGLREVDRVGDRGRQERDRDADRDRRRATCTGGRRTRSGSRAPSGPRTASARSRPRRRV